MERLIKKYGNEELMKRVNAGTLRGLDGIGPAKERKVMEYYKGCSGRTKEEVEMEGLLYDAGEYRVEDWEDEMGKAYARGPEGAQRMFRTGMKWIVGSAGFLALKIGGGVVCSAGDK